MADFDPILRLILQEYGENPDAWGGQLNTGALTRVGEAFTMVGVTVNANVTLTVENGLSDQARRLGFIFSGAGGFQVTHPAIAKPYLLVNNCAADITFKPQGGTGATIRKNTKVWYFPSADGLTGYVIDYRLSDLQAAAANISLGGFRATNAADPVDPQDLSTKNYIDTIASSGDLATVAAIAAQIVTLAEVEDGTVATNAISDLAPAADEIIILAPQAAAIAQLAGMFVGASATDPTTRLNGSPLQAGDYYLNTTGTPAVRVYSGSTWIPIAAVTIASQAEAVAGVNNTNVMTPLRTSQAIAALASGYQEFTASGTWTKPSAARWVFVEVIGGGGGGGSGQRAAAATNKSGGSGGGGAPVITKLFNAPDLASSVSITVGAAGAGGAAIGVDSTAGNNGTAGGTSSFGTLLSSLGGNFGLGGSGGAAIGSAGQGWYGIAGTGAKATAFEGPTGANANVDRSTLYAGAGGGYAGSAVMGAGSSAIFSGAGGGGGGGENTSNVQVSGSDGGTTGSYTYGGGALGGTSAASVSTVGANGSAALIGGGGGGGSQTAIGRAGGNGGIGAGGGGGGSSRNGFASGAGGNGGGGRVRVWWG